MKKPVKKPAKRKPAPSKTKTKTKQEWAEVIRRGESLLKSAGVKI